MKPPEIGDRYVTISVDEKGDIKIEAHGFHGVGCKDATRGIEAALGVVEERTEKPEMYEAGEERLNA